VYRRYTSFALEAIEQTFNGSVDYGKKVSCTVSRNGDLVSTMFLEVTLKKSSGASFYPAENFLKEVELEIGGQRIDKHYADWYRIYDELFRSADEKDAYRRLVDFDTPAAGSETGVVKRFYIPLIFFFNKSPGLALPLIALQYHEVKLNFTLASAAEMALNGVDTSYTPTAALYVTYVFLKSGNESDVATLASGNKSARSPNCLETRQTSMNTKLCVKTRSGTVASVVT
jgi:hypothetical protein